MQTNSSCELVPRKLATTLAKRSAGEFRTCARGVLAPEDTCGALFVFWLSNVSKQEHKELAAVLRRLRLVTTAIALVLFDATG
jgi:hypothetical protein